MREYTSGIRSIAYEACTEHRKTSGEQVYTMADRCHATLRATRVLYSTAHVSLARARVCTI